METVQWQIVWFTLWWCGKRMKLTEAMCDNIFKKIQWWNLHYFHVFFSVHFQLCPLFFLCFLYRASIPTSFIITSDTIRSFFFYHFFPSIFICILMFKLASFTVNSVYQQQKKLQLHIWSECTFELQLFQTNWIIDYYILTAQHNTKRRNDEWIKGKKLKFHIWNKHKLDEAIDVIVCPFEVIYNDKT